MVDRWEQLADGIYFLNNKNRPVQFLIMMNGSSRCRLRARVLLMSLLVVTHQLAGRSLFAFVPSTTNTAAAIVLRRQQQQQRSYHPHPLTQLRAGSRGGGGGGKKLAKAISKENLPSKICVVCQRPFTWRKKWERSWDEVTACSKRCNSERRSSIGVNKKVDN